MKKRILFYSWLIVIVGFAFVSLFKSGDIDSLYQIDLPITFARSLYIFFLAFVLSFMVASGIVDLRKYRFLLKYFVIPVIGFAMFIFLIFNCIMASIESTNLIEAKECLLNRPNSTISDYENKWSKKNLTSEQRFVMSREYAKNKYTDLGIIVEYQNQNGVNVTYSPTQDEINYREEFLVSWAKIKLKHSYDRELYLHGAIIFCLLLFSSIIFGVSFPIARNEI